MQSEAGSAVDMMSDALSEGENGSPTGNLDAKQPGSVMNFLGAPEVSSQVSNSGDRSKSGCPDYGGRFLIGWLFPG